MDTQESSKPAGSTFTTGPNSMKITSLAKPKAEQPKEEAKKRCAEAVKTIKEFNGSILEDYAKRRKTASDEAPHMEEELKAYFKGAAAQVEHAVAAIFSQ